MKNKTRGQALVEFALILPILLLLILGIIEGARIIWAYITVQNAAREAARYAITGQPYDEAGNPWTFRPDRYSGCDPEINEQGNLAFGLCAAPNDRVDAIIGVALERGKELGIDQPAIHPGVYEAAGYVDQGGTYGVQVWGQENIGGAEVVTQVVDYAGTEGLNVLVAVYYNVKILDPLYAAIIPDGYVHLAGEVQMQNEGIDSALGSLPPGGIAPPEAPEGATPPPPGQTNTPIVLSLDGSTVDAGSDLNVRLEYHPANQKYDVYLYSISLGYVAICQGVDVGAFGSQDATCNVPADTTPGSYQLVSILINGEADPANHVGEGDIVDVLYPGEPLLTIAQSYRWPPGSTITFLLYGHQPCPEDKYPCPPYQEYDIALIGGIYESPGEDIPPPVRVDELGSASKTWTIPSTLKPGSYTAVTYRRDTSDPVIASTALEIVPAEIVIQGGNRWPAGAAIRVSLRGHAPERTYRLRWIDTQTGATEDMGTVTTDQFGNSQAPIQFRIPANTPATIPPDPPHRIISFEEGGSGAEVASTEVEVFIPEGAYILVVGGDRWPAGSPIQIELYQHDAGPYDLYFERTSTGERTLIESGIAPDASGFYQTTYVIPITTEDGTYELKTVPDGGNPDDPAASTEIYVESVPLIRLAEGNTVRPRSKITVQLRHHAPNDSYDIYLDGNRLFTVQTNASGSEDGIYQYDLNNLPGLEGGPFDLESRKDGQTVASTEIYIRAPDLQITDIQFPPDLRVNEPISVTVTVRNNSSAPIVDEWFDVDIYIDPVHPPTTSSQFPPGDYKRWLKDVPGDGTTPLVLDVTLPGTQHTIYGRVDTSDYIVETVETNNIYQTTISSDVCVGEISNALDAGANWTGQPYGDADKGSFTLDAGRMTVTSDGLSASDNSDKMYLVYYNPQMVRGDFEVRVRMTEGPGDDAEEEPWAVAGLEVRAAVANAASPKVELGVANSEDTSPQPGVQAIYRDGSGADRPPGAGTDAAVSFAHPVWLRIVRSGDRFDYYYFDSDTDSATPPADDAWIAHGSKRMENMGDEVAVGFFNSSGDSDVTDTSSFDNFYVCLRSPDAVPGGEDFPPGLTVCTDNLIQNGGFEVSTGWTTYGGASAGVNVPYTTNDAFEGGKVAYLFSGEQNAWYRPELGQLFQMPDWVISKTTEISLSLSVCERDSFDGSGADPKDHLRVALRTSSELISAETQEMIIASGTTASTVSCRDRYSSYSADLAEAIKAAGDDPEKYDGDLLELYFYDVSNNLNICSPPGGSTNPDCYETDFFIDNVRLEICTTQLEPPPEVGKIYKVGGPLRVFIGGAPQPKQGVRVWTYRQNGELLTTYSLHDSNYFFYNLDPGEKYVFYAEYWDGPNLYSAFREVTLELADAHGDPPVIDDLSLLLR